MLAHKLAVRLRLLRVAFIASNGECVTGVSVVQVSVALGEFGAPQHLCFLEDYVPGARSPEEASPKSPRGGESKEVASDGGGKGGAELKRS